MACRQPPPQQLALPLWGPPRPAAPTPPPDARRWLSLDERMARRATWCDNHEVHACPLCEEVAPPKRRKRKSSEDGVDLRALNRDNPREARRLRLLAEGLLKRGAEAAEVHAETGIRMNTLHQMRTRIREERAEELLKRGVEPAEVHEATGVRMATLHQRRSRLREEGLIPEF